MRARQPVGMIPTEVSGCHRRSSPFNFLPTAWRLSNNPHGSERSLLQQTSIEIYLHHYKTCHFGLRNGPFRLAKRTVLRSKTDRFATPNGIYWQPSGNQYYTETVKRILRYELLLHTSVVILLSLRSPPA